MMILIHVANCKKELIWQQIVTRWNCFKCISVQWSFGQKWLFGQKCLCGSNGCSAETAFWPKYFCHLNTLLIFKILTGKVPVLLQVQDVVISQSQLNDTEPGKINSLWYLCLGPPGPVWQWYIPRVCPVGSQCGRRPSLWSRWPLATHGQALCVPLADLPRHGGVRLAHQARWQG